MLTVYKTDKIKNKNQIRQLINFCKKYNPGYKIAWLEIDATEGKTGINGAAYGLEGSYITSGKLSKIELNFGLKPKYPRNDCYRKSAGYVRFNSWKEEFILVLSHELRHVHQSWSKLKPFHYEVDAEKHGIKVLNEYRRYINCF